MRPTRAAASAVMLALTLLGCQQTPPSSPNQNRLQPDSAASERPKFVASPTPTPSGPPGVPSDWPSVIGGPGNYTADFDEANPSLADWKDPKQDDGYTHSWLFSGGWSIVGAMPIRNASGSIISRPAGRALEYNDLRPQPALSFRRYAGDAFGTDNGELPNRYAVMLQVTPITSREEFFFPVGDQGTPVYYIDPTHYVEVLLKNDKFEVWECNGGEPLKWRGWRPLFEEAASHSAGVPVNLGAEVDATRGTIRVYKNGQFKTEVRSDIVKPYSHYFALRGASNRVQFDNLVIRSN